MKLKEIKEHMGGYYKPEVLVSSRYEWGKYNQTVEIHGHHVPFYLFRGHLISRSFKVKTRP